MRSWPRPSLRLIEVTVRSEKTGLMNYFVSCLNFSPRMQPFAVGSVGSRFDWDMPPDRCL